jgi:hypothetical protein
VRAGIVSGKKKLDSFRWSSYPAYRRPKLRQSWLRTDRLLGEHGLAKDGAATRREFERRMKQARLEPGDQELVRRGWRIGAEDFRDWFADKLARCGCKGERASVYCRNYGFFLACLAKCLQFPAQISRIIVRQRRT